MVGGVESFYTRPLTLVLLAISIVAVAWPIISERKKAKKQAASSGEHPQE